MSPSISSLLANVVPLALATNGTLAVMAQIVMLQARRPRRNGTAFLAGYAVVIAGVVLLGDLVINGHVAAEQAADRELSVVNLLVGLGLVIFAVAIRVQSRRRPTGTEEPAFIHKMRGIGTWSALAAGVLVPTYPPAIAAATVFARSDATSAARLAVLFVFVVLATLSASVPLVAHLVAPAATSARLEQLMAWLLRHRMAFAFWVLLALGLGLVAREAVVLGVR